MNHLFDTGISVRSWTAVGNWIWTPSSTLVNEFRFGYDSVSQGFTIGDQNIIPDGSGGLCTATGCGGGHYPLNSGVTVGGGLPFIQISGFTGGGGAAWATRMAPVRVLPAPARIPIIRTVSRICGASTPSNSAGKSRTSRPIKSYRTSGVFSFSLAADRPRGSPTVAERLALSKTSSLGLPRKELSASATGTAR